MSILRFLKQLVSFSQSFSFVNKFYSVVQIIEELVSDIFWFTKDLFFYIKIVLIKILFIFLSFNLTANRFKQSIYYSNRSKLLKNYRKFEYLLINLIV